MALRPLLAVVALMVAVAVGLGTESRSSAAIEPRNRDLPCPNDVDILPCVCHTNELYLMILDCSLVKTNAELEAAFSADFPFTEFFELRIVHDPNDVLYDLTEIRSDIFKTLTFQRVTITGTKVSLIQENVFSYSYETLIQLNLQNNRISQFPFESLFQYSQLEILLLDDNMLPTLERFSSDKLRTLSVGHNSNLQFTPDVLENMPSLEKLNMEYIGLMEIPQHLFRNLSSINFLNFNGNDLVELNEYAFDLNGTQLGQLLLANNRIFNVLPNSIKGLTTNAIFDLTNNKISELYEVTWQPILDQMLDGKLDLTGNPLRCGCDMDWLFLNTSTVVNAEVYLPIITDQSTCYDGSQVIYLDYHVFQKHCT